MRSPTFQSLVRGCLLSRRRNALRRLGIAPAAWLLLQFAVAQSPQPDPVPPAKPRTIQVASLGDGDNADALRRRIVDRLDKSGRLKVVESPTLADLVLRGTSNIWPTGNISFSPRSNSASQTIYAGYLSVELVNKDNRTVWSYLVTPSRFRTESITDDLADHLVVRLLDAVQRGLAQTNAHSPLAGSPITRVALRAAGSTLAAPLYLKWFQSAGVSVAYDAIGSEAGIEQLAQGKVDFAASDMPLTAENITAKLDAVQFPMVVGGVVPIYNLPSLDRPLRLTPQALAGIYLGSIRKWDDPRIVETNRGAHLPDAEIAVIHRSDGSGTTYVWTSFLSLASSEWKHSVGVGLHVTWPVGPGAAGSNGVAELVAKTPYSIGYVELIFAIQHRLGYAAVRNPSGEFIKADLASITHAAEGAAKDGGAGFRFSILNAANKDAYPISTFTWLLVPSRGLGDEKRRAIAALLNWLLTAGQKECASLGYAPLPHDIALSEIQASGSLK